MRSDQRNGSSVLDRGFRLLGAFQAEGRQMSLAELARRSQLPKATVFRLINQLVDVGAVERYGDSYRLGLRLFELGSMATRQRRLRDAALPFMEDLYEATHETVHLGVLDGHEVLYIEKIVGRRRSPISTQVGTRKPLYCTALGKAILSYSDPDLVQAILHEGLTRYTSHTVTTPERLLEELSTIAKSRLAYDREEYKLGNICVASPLIDRDQVAGAAISIAGPTDRFDPGRVAAAVRTAASSISRALNENPWPTR